MSSSNAIHWEQGLALNSAGSAFASANTPLYLLRRLKEDSEVSRIARERSEQELIEALQRSLLQSAGELDDLVRPFALLVALGIKGNRRAIAQVRASTNAENPWFDTIAAALEATIVPTKTTIIRSVPRIEATERALPVGTTRKVISFEG